MKPYYKHAGISIIAGLLGAAIILAALALSWYVGRTEGMRAGEAHAEWWRYEAKIHQGEAAFCREIIGDAANQAAAQEEVVFDE